MVTLVTVVVDTMLCSDVIARRRDVQAASAPAMATAAAARILAAATAVAVHL